MITLNLIPASLRERNAVRRRRTRWILGLGLYAGLVAAAGICFAVTSSPDTWRLDSDQGRTDARVSAAEESLSSVHKQLTEQRRLLVASETVGLHPDWSILLGAIADTRADDILLDSIDLKTREIAQVPEPKPKPDADSKAAPARPARPLEHYSLSMRGFALSQPDIMKFVRRLEDLGPLRKVRLLQTSAAEHRGVPAFAFVVECELAEIDAETPEAAP